MIAFREFISVIPPDLRHPCSIFIQLQNML